jgi:glycosyltransferase involved in cell wall biosynthesis
LKILQISQKNLSPPFDGGKIAMRAMAEGLRKAGHSVDQWVLDTPRQPILSAENTAHPDKLFSGKLDTRIKALAALKNFLFSRTSYNIQRFESKNIAFDVAELISQNGYEIVQAESIFALALIAPILAELQIPVVLRAHNAEHMIWERMAAASSNPLVSFYLRTMSKRLKNDELHLMSRVQGLIAISDSDLKLFRSLGYLGKAVVAGIPALRILDSDTNYPTNPAQIFHLGAMDWLPNREGIEWFLDKVWPQLSAHFPQLNLSLAGKSMPESIRKRATDRIIIEQAENASEYMLSRGMMIVPLRSGGGIRAKIIEGLALGRIILTTSVGAEGIPVKHREHAFICDTAAEFIEAIEFLQLHPKAIEQVSKNARTFARVNYSLEEVTRPVIDLYNELTHA